MMQHYHMRQVSTPLQWSLKKTRKTQDTRTYWEIYEKKYTDHKWLTNRILKVYNIMFGINHFPSKRQLFSFSQLQLSSVSAVSYKILMLWLFKIYFIIFM